MYPRVNVLVIHSGLLFSFYGICNTFTFQNTMFFVFGKESKGTDENLTKIKTQIFGPNCTLSLRYILCYMAV